MTTRRYRLRVTCLGLLFTMLAGCSVGGPSTQAVIDDDGLHGTAIDEPYVVGDVELVDTSGEPFALADVETDLTLVFFGYTHCPDICGIVMSTIASAVNQLDDELRDRVAVVMVTTDPTRDDPATLRAYLDRFDPRFEGATGEMAEILRAAKALGVFIERGEKLPSGGYEVVHSDPVIGLGPDGDAHTIWNKEVTSAALAEDIKTLLTQ